MTFLVIARTLKLPSNILKGKNHVCWTSHIKATEDAVDRKEESTSLQETEANLKPLEAPRLLPRSI